MNRRQALASVGGLVAAPLALANEKKPARKPAPTPHPMGLGELTRPDFIFARTFRFVVRADHLAGHYVNKCRFDLVMKKLLVRGWEIFECGPKTIPFSDWATTLIQGGYPQERLSLTAYDGCGHALYRYDFNPLRPYKFVSDYDMSSSDAVQPTLGLHFDHYERSLFSDPVPAPDDLSITPPDNLTVIDHLHGRMWLPNDHHHR